MSVSCGLHGSFDARIEWGCPECVIEMRRMLRRLKERLAEYANCPLCEEEPDFDGEERDAGRPGVLINGAHGEACPFPALMAMELEK